MIETATSITRKLGKALAEAGIPFKKINGQIIVALETMHQHLERQRIIFFPGQGKITVDEFFDVIKSQGLPKHLQPDVEQLIDKRNRQKIADYLSHNGLLLDTNKKTKKGGRGRSCTLNEWVDESEERAYQIQAELRAIQQLEATKNALIRVCKAQDREPDAKLLALWDAEIAALKKRVA